MQKTGNEALVLTLLGLAGIAVSVVSLAGRRNRFTWALFGVGGVSLIFGVYYHIALRSQLPDSDNDFLPISLGVGIYICIVAGVVALVGAVLDEGLVRH